jgi:hypothetical protein
MDTKTVQLAYRFQSLIDSKHQFARNLDPFTKQLIRQITRKYTSAAPLPLAYSPTKEAFQADLTEFAKVVFQRLSTPRPAPPPPPNPDSDTIRHILAVVQDTFDRVQDTHDRVEWVAERVDSL